MMMVLMRNACRPVTPASHWTRPNSPGTSEIMPDARFASLTPLFAPRSVAVLGASSDPTRISGRPLAYMKAQGFQGALYPINPNRAEVQGLKAYPSVAALPETPDVAIVAIAAEIAENSITELAERGVNAAVMFTAGFAEVDDAGAVAQDNMVAIARAQGMRVLGPNCLGVFDARRSCEVRLVRERGPVPLEGPPGPFSGRRHACYLLPIY